MEESRGLARVQKLWEEARKGVEPFGDLAPADMPRAIQGYISSLEAEIIHLYAEIDAGNRILYEHGLAMGKMTRQLRDAGISPDTN